MLIWPLLCVVSTLAVMALVVVLCQSLYSLVSTLALALVFSYLLLSLVNGAETAVMWASTRLHGQSSIKSLLTWSPRANPRLLAVLLVFLMAGIGVAYGIITLVPVLMAQLETFVASLPGLVQQSGAFLQKIPNASALLNLIEVSNQTGPETSQIAVPAISDQTNWPLEKISTLAKSALDWVHTATSGTWDAAWDHAVGVAEGISFSFLNTLCVVLLVFYALLDGPKLTKAIVTTSPKVFQSSLAFIMQQTHQTMLAFIKGQVLLGALTGGYMFVIYSILGTPFALFLSVLFFIAELLPVVGTWIGITFGLVTIVLFGEPWTAIPVWLCSYIYQTIKDNLLAPKIVGDVMGLHPILVLLSILIGAQTGGLIGILLALPLASLVMATTRYWLKGPASVFAREFSVKEQAG